MFHEPMYVFHVPVFLFHVPVFLFHVPAYLFHVPVYLFHVPVYMSHVPVYMSHVLVYLFHTYCNVNFYSLVIFTGIQVKEGLIQLLTEQNADCPQHVELCLKVLVEMHSFCMSRHPLQRAVGR